MRGGYVLLLWSVCGLFALTDLYLTVRNKPSYGAFIWPLLYAWTMTTNARREQRWRALCESYQTAIESAAKRVAGLSE